MTARRGWCPDVHAPMPAADGLIVRVKPPLGRLSAKAARVIAAAALRDGSGMIELTARANLQVRGLRPDSAPQFAATMVAAGLAAADPAVERRRNVLVSPQAGADPAIAGDPEAVAATLLGALAMAHELEALPGKFGWLVDGGSVASVAGSAADILIRLGPDGALVSVAGAGLVHACDVEEAVPAGIELARAFLTLAPRYGVRRMAALVPASGAEPVFAAAGLAASAREIPRPAAAPRAGAIALAGGADDTGETAMLAAPFGRMRAEGLAQLADLAERFGDGVLRLTPLRAVVIAGVARDAMTGLLHNASAAGMIVDPDDPRLAIITCAGSPGCARANADTNVDAHVLARMMHGWHTIHLAGCSKGCAHPGVAAVTLVAAPDGYALVRNGRASDAPECRGLTLAAAARLAGVAA